MSSQVMVSADVLLRPMLAHVAWTTLLYVVLTLVRAPTAWGIGARADGSSPWAALEARVSANLSNQFEWPLFFYVACLLLIIDQSRLDLVQLVLAWVFVFGRILHSLVQITMTGVRLRGVVFTFNFLAVLGMWAWMLLL